MTQKAGSRPARGGRIATEPIIDSDTDGANIGALRRSRALLTCGDWERVRGESESNSLKNGVSRLAKRVEA